MGPYHRQAGQYEQLIVIDYAATAYAGAKLPTTTLSLAFNLFCLLITGNSTRTRRLFQPNILSNPKRPHKLNC